MATLTLSHTTLKPLSDRILVRVADAEETTAGGIILPSAAQEKPQVGEVIEVGPGQRNDDGSRSAIDINKGDRVLYSKYSGTDIKVSGINHVLLREQDILATVA